MKICFLKTREPKELWDIICYVRLNYCEIIPLVGSRDLYQVTYKSISSNDARYSVVEL